MGFCEILKELALLCLLDSSMRCRGGISKRIDEGVARFFMLADGLFGKRLGVFRWRGGCRFEWWRGESVLKVLEYFGGRRRC